MQAVGLLRSVFISCGTVATVPRKTQITNKLVLNLRVSAADRRKKAAREHVVYHMPHSLGQHVMPGNCFRATAPQHRWGPSLRMRHRRDRGGAIPPARSRVTIGDANRLDRAQVGRGPLGAKHRPERIIAHGPINFTWAPAATAASRSRLLLRSKLFVPAPKSKIQFRPTQAAHPFK
jgi:hypothetical protein